MKRIMVGVKEVDMQHIPQPPIIRKPPIPPKPFDWPDLDERDIDYDYEDNIFNEEEDEGEE